MLEPLSQVAACRGLNSTCSVMTYMHGTTSPNRRPGSPNSVERALAGDEVVIARANKPLLPLNRIEMLGLTLSELGRLESLPWHHRDPFDRVMVAQALERDLALVSSDDAFDAYDVERVW